MDRPDRFETPRLVGVPLSARDAEGFCRMKADPVGTAAYFALPLTKDAALHKLARLMADHRTDTAYTYALYLKQNDAFIGTIVLWNLDAQRHEGEVGYELLRAYWGLGYMKEALPAFLRHMRDTRGYTTFTACPGENNAASNRLLLGAGFTPEGSAVEDGHTLNLYRLVMPEITPGG